MAVNTSHDTAWEDIQLVIQAIEKQALDSKSRVDILFYNYATIEQGKHVVHMGVDTSEGVKKAREGANEANWDGDLLELMGMFDKKQPKVDENGNELPWTGSPGDVASKYLQECLGCSFRISFDYQLNPLSFLGPLLEAAKQIEASVKRVEDALDPMQTLAEVCSFMENLKIFCLQDIATLLMSLKMLLTSYAMQAFNLKLDWTVILGPILKAIAELLIAIIDAILNLALAPIDCALGALRSAEQLERAGRSLAGGISTLGQKTAGSATATGLQRNVHTAGTPVKDPLQKQPYGLGSLVGKTEPSGASAKPAYDTGFAIRVGQPMDKAIQEPGWARASVLQKAVVAVSTARQKLVNLFDNLKLTIDSLSQLVSGGLCLSLDLGGILLALFDLIGLIMMIVRMFSKVGDPRKINWCDYLAENPDVLREQLERQLGQRVKLHSDRTQGVADSNVISYSVVVNGTTVGDIPLCVSTRDPGTKQFLDKWIQELGSAS